MTDQATAPHPPAAPIDDAFLEPAFVEREAELAVAFQRAVLADPSLLDRMPHGVTLVLLPEGEPHFFERRVALGLAAIRQGRDVLFRHVRTDASAGAW